MGDAEGSGNFGFLAAQDARLARLGVLAERVFSEDPNTCLLKLRQFGEYMAQLACARVGIESDGDEKQVDRLRRLSDRGVLSRDAADLFHHIRKTGNVATHGFDGDHRTALACLKVARTLGVWYVRSFGGNRGFNPGPFVPPPDPREAARAVEAELARLRTDLDRSLSEADRARRQMEDEATARLTAEERAAAAERERAEWEALAEAVEADRSAAEARLAEVQAAAQAAPAMLIQSLVQEAEEQGQALDLDEQATRALIDGHLRDAGWQADTASLTHASGARPRKGTAMAIAEWPTETGIADYVLFVDTMPIAVVEAKRHNVNVSQTIDQAQRYAGGFVMEAGMTAPEGGPWGDYRIPFAFSTNGRPFLRQMETLSGIWFRDLRRATNLRRPLEGWYSPQGLAALLRQDETAAEADLAGQAFGYNFDLRDYQERAIRKVEEALIAGRREVLVAMATGTGKTKTCITLVYRLLKAKRFRRILFLVDRTALGEQAGNAFKDTRMEQQQPFADIFEVRELGDAVVEAGTKVHIATVQALVKRVLFADDGRSPPPVDQYDCVVVDECHRGYLLDRDMGDDEIRFRDQRDYVSKYRRVLDRFDAVRIGLTATPALHTTDIFGPPVFTYGFREAVIDGWLVDHDPPIRFHTDLSDEGIRWEKGETLELFDARTGAIDTAEAPDDLGFEVEDFNRRVITEPFNRVICEQLADHIDPSAPGKTLVFCATDLHCDMVVKLLKAAFTAKYGPVRDDLVQKITGRADKPLEKIRHYKNEDMPKVAVTVDLLTTGIDVPEIVNLVFLRRVNSRILYEQMIGRATRLCPEIGKTAFRVFDAVGLYDAMQDLTEMRPVAANPNVSFGRLTADLLRLYDIAAPEPDEQDAETPPAPVAAPVTGLQDGDGQTPFAGPPPAPAPLPPAEAQRRAEGGRYLLDQILARLQRRCRRLKGEQRELVTAAAGCPPEELVKRLKEGSPEDAARWLSAHGNVVALLDAGGGDGGPVHIPISKHEDTFRRTSVGYGAERERPEDYLKRFHDFLEKSGNTLPALTVVTQRPRDLTREQLKEVALKLAEAGFREADLRAAWREARNEDIAAGIIGFIRQAALGDPLEPWDLRVERAMGKVLARPDWTGPQRDWLKRIGKQIRNNLVVDRGALDADPFRDMGGFRHIDKVFGGRLADVLGEINEGIWEKAG